jgi:hypothetical protein
MWFLARMLFWLSVSSRCCPSLHRSRRHQRLNLGQQTHCLARVRRFPTSVNFVCVNPVPAPPAHKQSLSSDKRQKQARNCFISS